MKSIPAALGLSLLTQFTNALVCNGSDFPTIGSAYESDSFTILVNNQTQLDLLENCDTFEGGIVISTDWVGPVVLKGVKNITYEFVAVVPEEDQRGNIVDVGSINIPSVELRDLQYLNYLTINVNSDTLTNISAPNAVSISWIDITTLSSAAVLDFPLLQDNQRLSLSGPSASMSFPLLQNATEVDIIGSNISSTAFPSLTTVYSSLSLCSDDGFNLYSPKVGPFPPLAISFPALSNVSGLYIGGNISSISMPNLTTIPSDGQPFTIANSGLPLNIDFPLLHNSSYFELGGNIGNISIPSLLRITQITIDAWSFAAVNLSTLTYVWQLYIHGNLTSVSLPSLTSAYEIDIESTTKVINCQLKKIAPKIPSNTAFHCFNDNDNEETKTPLPTSKKVIIGCVCGIGGICLIAMVIGCSRRAKRKAAKRHKPSIGLRNLGNGRARRTGVATSAPTAVAREGRGNPDPVVRAEEPLPPPSYDNREADKIVVPSDELIVPPCYKRTSSEVTLTTPMETRETLPPSQERTSEHAGRD